MNVRVHGAIGCAVMTIGLMQPLNAFIRPHKVTKYASWYDGNAHFLALHFLHFFLFATHKSYPWGTEC